jgi:hypothetical protein
MKKEAEEKARIQKEKEMQAMKVRIELGKRIKLQ